VAAVWGHHKGQPVLQVCSPTVLALETHTGANQLQPPAYQYAQHVQLDCMHRAWQEVVSLLFLPRILLCHAEHPNIIYILIETF
jgi:hypothetical protein